MCTAGKQDSGRSGGDRGGPKRPGKGKGSRETRGRKEAREPMRWHTVAGGGMARVGRQRRGERERRAVNAMVHWGPGDAYLPVILHIVAQADEAGLEFLWPQRPAVVLPGVQRQVCKGRRGNQAAQRWGEGPGLHAEGRGRGTHEGGKHRVRGDGNKVMAGDSWGRWRDGWPGGQSEASSHLLWARAGVEAEWCRIKN